MQVLFDLGYENKKSKGLGWINGEVHKLKVEKSPIPHIGWNEIEIQKTSGLYKGIENFSTFYFLHSYYVKTNKKYFLTLTNYEKSFCSSVCKDNIFGVQFHPEKVKNLGRN